MGSEIVLGRRLSEAEALRSSAYLFIYSLDYMSVRNSAREQKQFSYHIICS